MIYGNLGRRIENKARAKPVTENEVIDITNNQILAKTLKSDYNQILLRVSNAPTGLRAGSPPGVVTF